MRKDYKNILLINWGGIGDEILFMPVIDSLKKEYKNAKITLALEPRSACITQLCPLIDEVIKTDIKASGIKKYFNMLKFLFNVRQKKFDIVISSGKSPLVAILLFLTGIAERIGFKSKTSFLLTKSVELNENQYASKMYHSLISPVCDSECSLPEIAVDNDYALPSPLEAKGFVAIHPGVSKMSIRKNILKCPDLTFWEELILSLLEKGEKVVLFGTGDDEDLISKICKNENITNNENFINYFKKTKSLFDMANMFAKAKCVICADSAPMHVAVGTNVKTFAIFGPTNEEKLLPKDEKFTAIKNNVPCRPCLWHKRAFNCGHSDCLKIDYKEIISKI